MGAAPYGKPKYAAKILEELVDLRDDGSFKLNMKYFAYDYGLTMTNERFARLFGHPRREARARWRSSTGTWLRACSMSPRRSCCAWSAISTGTPE